MKVIPLHEKTTKLCYRDSGDVISLPQDGSGPWIVVSTFADRKMIANTSGSGTFDYQIKDIKLVHLETGVHRTISLSTRVVHYPQAEVHLGKIEL